MIIPCDRKQDWEILTCEATSRGGLRITGINHNHSPDSPDRCFGWYIDEYSATSDRYDWSGCVFAEGAQERRSALVRRASLKD